MRRRQFLLAAAAVAAHRRASAQPAARIRRVGFIAYRAPLADMTGAEPSNPSVRSFVRAMRERGYVEGLNLVLELRSAEGRHERFAPIAAELVGLGADVIVTVGDEMADAVRRVTNIVPIVMASSTDPVTTGIVASLGRPGGNVTGFTAHAGPELDAKRLQSLTELIPHARRIAFLGLASEWDGPQGKAVRTVAQSLGVALFQAEHAPTQFADAFARIAAERPQALFVARHPSAWNAQRPIIEFAAAQRLPAIYHAREFVENGGLVSYGPNVADQFRRAAGHVDKILKGAKPADIPVEQPTKYELVVNLKTAAALGLTLPPSIIAQADEVIE
jgi:putative ABC transport system substrate-binding protein